MTAFIEAELGGGKQTFDAPPTALPITEALMGASWGRLHTSPYYSRPRKHRSSLRDVGWRRAYGHVAHITSLTTLR